MNILGKMQFAQSGLYFDIGQAKEFDLNRIKEILSQLEKDQIQGYVLALRFEGASFMVIPSQMTVKPSKLRDIIIGKKVFNSFTSLSTEFMTAEQVQTRAIKWLDNWRDYPSVPIYFIPCIIANVEGKWLWCTNQNKSVPKELIDVIETK